ncbi:MAG TPA: hypothetical protein VMW27_07305 [Thermoanaerobaculia bacterium]|nr:hypothetical protein [Thermoanaerobaculia bacterium]
MTDLKQVTSLHRTAMGLAEKALATQDSREARALFKSAFERERQAADLLETELDQEPTRSVLYRSAASLALDCGEPAEAERLAAKGLAGKPPQDIRGELEQLLALRKPASKVGRR